MDCPAVTDDSGQSKLCSEFLVEAHWSDMSENISSSQTVFLARLLLNLRATVAARFLLPLSPVWAMSTCRSDASVYRASLAAHRLAVNSQRLAHNQR